MRFFATIVAWSGEKDLAIERLKIVTQLPTGLSYGEPIDRIFLGSRPKFSGADAIRDSTNPHFRPYYFGFSKPGKASLVCGQ